MPMMARLADAAPQTTRTGASRSSGTACGRSPTSRAGACASRAATCATSPGSTRSCASWAARSAPGEPCSTARSSPSTSRAGRASSACSRACTSTSESAIRRRVADTPVVYMIFDLLYLDGHSTMPLPYTERRALLEELDLNGALAARRLPRRRRRGDARGQRRAGPRGRRRQAARQPLRARAAAAARWLKIKNHLQPGVRDRRLAAGRGRPQRRRSARWRSATTTTGSCATPATSAPASRSRRCGADAPSC